MKSHFELLTQMFFKKLFFRVAKSKVKILFYNFQVTNSNFELLFRKMMKQNFDFELYTP